MSARKKVKKNGNWIFVVLVVILLLGFAFYYFKDDILKNNKNIENKENNTVNEKFYTKAEVLDMLKGVWGYCYNDSGNEICYSLYLSVVDGNDRISFGKYATSGGIFGKITDVQSVANTVYKLKVFSEGCTGNDCIDEIESANYEILVDLKNIKNKTISVDYNDQANEYLYAGTDFNDSEEYFMNKLNH